MHPTYLLFGLPLVLAHSGSLTSLFDRGLTKRDHDPKLAPNQARLCDGSDAVYTFPYCQKDSDCQRPGSKLSNLAPSGFQLIDTQFKFGDGFCYHSKETGKSTCGVNLGADDDLMAFCKALKDFFGTKLAGIVVLNACMDPKQPENYVCDLYCDPRVNPACATEKNYTFPCAGEVPFGGDATGPASWICPGTKLPPGAPAPSGAPSPSGSPSPAGAPTPSGAPSGGAPTPPSGSPSPSGGAPSPAGGPSPSGGPSPAGGAPSPSGGAPGPAPSPS